MPSANLIFRTCLNDISLSYLGIFSEEQPSNARDGRQFDNLLLHSIWASTFAQAHDLMVEYVNTRLKVGNVNITQS